jgi:hypothetical protein
LGKTAEPEGNIADAEMEKGLLWGTKLAFFRRKEIRVSLLSFIMQSPYHFNSSMCFLLKCLIHGRFTPSFLFPFQGMEVQFFVLFPDPSW